MSFFKKLMKKIFPIGKSFVLHSRFTPRNSRISLRENFQVQPLSNPTVFEEMIGQPTVVEFNSDFFSELQSSINFETSSLSSLKTPSSLSQPESSSVNLNFENPLVQKSLISDVYDQETRLSTLRSDLLNYKKLNQVLRAHEENSQQIINQQHQFKLGLNRLENTTFEIQVISDRMGQVVEQKFLEKLQDNFECQQPKILEIKPNLKNFNKKQPSGYVLEPWGGGFGGGNRNNEGGDDSWQDLPDGMPPGFRFFILIVAGAVLLIIYRFCSKLQNWILNQFDRAVKDYLRGLQQWIHKRKKNRVRRKIAFLLKCFLGLLGLLIGPEAAAVVLENVSNRWVRAILRSFFPIIRLLVLLALFFGCTFHSLKFVQILFQKFHFLEPFFVQLLNFLSGPSRIPLEVLFVERLAKTFVCSSLLNLSIDLCPTLVRLNEKKELQKLGLFSCCIGSAAFLFWDHYLILRKFAYYFCMNPSFSWMVGSILGRFALLIASAWTMPRTFWASTIFMLFSYFLGLYSLAANATPNIFP